MNWDDLKIVLSLARAGSQSAAATLMGIDQSTVGRRLNAIEADLGTILFVRTKSGFKLTEVGEQVLARAKQVESAILWIEDDVSPSTDNLRGNVRIVGNHWTLAHLLDNGMNEFLATVPDLELSLVATNSHWSLARGRPEIALWFEIEPKEAEFAFPVCQVPYAIYERRDRTKQPPNWVTFLDPQAKRAPNRWLERHKLPDEKVNLTANDAGLVASAILSGARKGLLPCCMAEKMPKLIRVGNRAPVLERTLHVHANTDLVHTRRLQRVLDWLQSNLPVLFADPNSLVKNNS